MTVDYQNLNTSILRRLTKLLEDDPGRDLEGTLHDLCAAYSRTRSSVDRRRAKKARQDINSPRTLTTPHSKSQNRRGHDLTPLSFRPPRPFSQDFIKIMSPLTPRTLTSLNLEEGHSLAQLGEAILHLFAIQEPLAVNIATAIVPLDDGIVVKIGFELSLDELYMLQHLHDHTPTISAPKALGFVTIGPVSCLFMTRLPGQTLDVRWPNMNLRQKRSVQATLNDMFATLRNVPWRPEAGDLIGSLSSQPTCKDARRILRRSARPIYTESDFNEFIGTDSYSPQYVSARYRAWAMAMLRSDHRILLTHGDLHPGNILVDIRMDHGLERVIVGVIDWEMGGFYPEYWEHLKAMNLREVKDESDWWDFLPPAILGYEQEIAIDRLIERSVLVGV